MSSNSRIDEESFLSFITERRTSLHSIIEEEPTSEDQLDQKNETIPNQTNRIESQHSGNLWKSESFSPSLASSSSMKHRIQETAEDSSISKLSAATLGYFEDPYLHFFVKQPCRRSPLINRGYFSRVAAIRMVVATFFKSLPEKDRVVQIVNLGAGFDTLYFWISDFWRSYKFHLYEIDFPEILSKKLSILMRRQPLQERLTLDTLCISSQEITANANYRDLPIKVTKHYTMIPADLKEIDLLDSMIRQTDFDVSAPTLFISECVLIYMDPSDSDRILGWLSRLTHGPSTFILYEQVNPSDTFGRTMVRNMEMRGYPLLGINTYPTIEDQKTRFTSLNWFIVTAVDMYQLYEKFLDKYELVRVQGLELLDEMEEWKLIQAHYIFLVAVQPAQDNDWSYIRNFWDDTQHETQELPRFTTEEFRKNCKAIQSMYSRDLITESPIKPGFLSSLFCPEFISNNQKKIDSDLMLNCGGWLLNIHNSGLVYTPYSDDI